MSCRCKTLLCKHTTAEARAEYDLEQMRQERDEARATARVLAHSYQHDSRPPQRVVQRALSYPVKSVGRLE